MIDVTMKGRSPDTAPHFFVIRQWDGTREALVSHPGAQALIERVGFDVDTLVGLLTSEFPSDVSIHEELDNRGSKTEDVAVEQLTVNGWPLDRIMVTGYPAFAKPVGDTLTQFLSGGEVILVKDGVAELTYAENVEGDSVLRDRLQTVRLEEGDLVISTDTPNNWSGMGGNEFRFLYFVGNPNGPQRYSDVLKRSVSVR